MLLIARIQLQPTEEKDINIEVNSTKPPTYAFQDKNKERKAFRNQKAQPEDPCVLSGKKTSSN